MNERTQRAAMRVLNAECKERTVCWLMGVLFFIALVPVILIARYAVPSVDDYTYGDVTHRVWQASGSLPATMAAAAQIASDTYQSWQGSFSAIWLMAMHPAIFGEQYYALTPLIMLISMMLGSWCFSRALFGKLLGAPRAQYLTIAAVWLFICIQYLPGPAQGLFWYNGGIYYTFFYSLSLLLLSCVILYIKRDKQRGRSWLYIAAMCLLSVVIGGGNYVTLMLTMLVFGGCILALVFLRNPKWRALLLPFMLLVASFVINMAAPGNAVRGELYVANSPIWTIGQALLSAAQSIPEWFSIPLLLSLVLLMPMLWKIAANVEFSFRWPLAVLALSFGVYAAQFSPPIYVLGFRGQDRIINIIFCSYVLLWILNLFYILGWLMHRRAETLQRARARAGSAGYPVALLVLVAVVIAGISHSLFYNSMLTSVCAFRSLRSGEAQEYYAQAQERLQVLHDDTCKDVVFAHYTCEPYLLYYDDAQPDPDDWRNVDLAKYYDKNSIIVE